MTNQEKQLYTLQKTGEAIYKHRKLAQMAKEAEKAVDYLASKGVLN